MANVPLEFAKLELFPAISVWHPGDSIRVNFGGTIPFGYNFHEFSVNFP